MNDNPYQPPCDSSDGHYDWSLSKRVFLAFSLITIWYLLISGIVTWKEYSASRSLRTPREQIESFFLNWKADPRLSKQ